MHAHPQFDRYARHLETLAPTLATQWVADMLQAMRDPAESGVAHLDRKALAGLLLAVEPLRIHIAECLAGHLLQGIQGAEARALGRGTAASALSGFSIEELTLVDETQAEKDIEISRVVQLVDLKLEWELRELQGLAALLLPEARGGEDPTLCGPAVFARAISQTVYEQVLEPEQQAVWMRLAAPTLITQLRPVLPQLAEGLKAAGLQAPRYRAILTPDAGARPASAAAAAGGSPATATGAPAAVSLPGIDPQQLQALLQSMPLLQRGLPASAQRPAPPTLASSGDEPAFSLQPMAPTAAEVAATHALLGRLFARLMDDPQLAPALRSAIARLEAPVRQLAAHDPGVLSSEQHPAWALINRIASHSSAMPAHDTERGEAFKRFVDPLVTQLHAQGADQPEAYAEALQQVQSFIDEDREQQVARTRPSTDALSQMEAERRLLPLMRDQVEVQLMRAQDVSPLVQTFLRGPWIEVLAKVMATDGAESPEAQALVSTVDELLASLQRPETPEARADLRRRLPRLIGRVQQGMALIDLPQQHRNRVLAELMQTHRRHLAEKSEAPTETPAPTAPAAARPSAAAADTPAPRAPATPPPVADSVVPPAWEGHETHVGTLPTVPMALDDATDPADAWVDELRPGRRCKLFLQGVWATAQLAWASDNATLFMFTSNLAGGMHSMTRRALKRLRSEGLATDLADPSAVQRALGGVLKELGAA